MAALNDRLPEIMEDAGNEFAEYFNGYALNFNRALKGETPRFDTGGAGLDKMFCKSVGPSNNDAFRKAIEGGWHFTGVWAFNPWRSFQMK